jgi:hypothetical protein
MFIIFMVNVSCCFRLFQLFYNILGETVETILYSVNYQILNVYHFYGKCFMLFQTVSVVL